MCGIIGFSGAGKAAFDLNTIKILMYVNSKERGTDACGVFTPKLGILKSTGEAYNFLYKNEEKITPSDIFIGHVRAKTKGVNSDENAHPFQYENIVGVHNGTLTNSDDLIKEIGGLPIDFKVDSQAIFFRLGNDKKATVLSNLKGSAAVLFQDTTNPEVLYAFRNDERPLVFGKRPEGLYISSIQDPLEWTGCTDIEHALPGYIYEIKDGKISKRWKIPYHKSTENILEIKRISDIPAECLNDLILYINPGNNHIPYDHTKKVMAGYYRIQQTTLDSQVNLLHVDDTKDVLYTQTHKDSINLASVKALFIKGGFVVSNYTLTEGGKKKNKRKIANKGDLMKIDVPMKSFDSTTIKVKHLVSGRIETIKVEDVLPLFETSEVLRIARMQNIKLTPKEFSSNLIEESVESLTKRVQNLISGVSSNLLPPSLTNLDLDPSERPIDMAFEIESQPTKIYNLIEKFQATLSKVIAKLPANDESRQELIDLNTEAEECKNILISMNDDVTETITD